MTDETMRARLAAWEAWIAATPPSTVAEVAAAYQAHAEVYYRKGGKPTSQVGIIRTTLRTLLEDFGDAPAAMFDAMALKAVRRRFVEKGLSRVGVNRRASIITKMFRWAVSERMAPESTWTSCRSVEGLKRGRSEARETAPVGPVPAEHVEKVLPLLPRPVAAMVRLQLLTGMRPGEACGVRRCDIDESAATWIYRPASHKTEHHGRGRVVPIGPQGQALLRGFFGDDPASYLFSPREWMRERFGREGTYADRYNKDSYRNAVLRACSKAGIPPWHPNQLRHAYATDVRRRFGLEAAQVLLGHASADVTQIYAERDAGRAAAIAAEIG